MSLSEEKGCNLKDLKKLHSKLLESTLELDTRQAVSQFLSQSCKTLHVAKNIWPLFLFTKLAIFNPLGNSVVRNVPRDTSCALQVEGVVIIWSHFPVKRP